MRMLAAIFLCSLGGWLTAEIITSPDGRWVLSIIAGIIISFFSSLYICKKLGVE